MKTVRKILVVVSALAVPLPVFAIDLQCEALAEKMVNRLVEEGLLVQATDKRERALAISLESCAGAQQVAQQQQAVERQFFIKNWLFEKTGGKPGNKRLKNFKR